MLQATRGLQRQAALAVPCLEHARPLRLISLPSQLLVRRRDFAGGPPPALVLVDGQQSLELVKAELSRRLAANSQGVDVLTAGRQGITVALRAAAALDSEGGSSRRLRAFHFRKAGHEELAEQGLEPPAHASRFSSGGAGPSEGGEGGGEGRRGFRLSFLPREGQEAMQTDAPASKVLRVSGGTGQVLPLAKAVATEVARLPEGSVAVVETALRGKSKNVWTRIHRLAQAVAQAYEWQVSPKSPRVMTRRFRCTVGEAVSTEDVKRDPLGNEEGQQAGAEDLLRTGEKVQVIRLTLIPEEPPQHTSQHKQ